METAKRIPLVRFENLRFPGGLLRGLPHKHAFNLLCSVKIAGVISLGFNRSLLDLHPLHPICVQYPPPPPGRLQSHTVRASGHMRMRHDTVLNGWSPEVRMAPGVICVHRIEQNSCWALTTEPSYREFLHQGVGASSKEEPRTRILQSVRLFEPIVTVGFDGRYTQGTYKATRM